MTERAQPPLVAPEVDLRDFVFMPLDVVRLRDSGLAVRSSGDEFRAAVMLWCASWHQLPAASLPDDDAVLAQLAGYGRDLRGWKRVRKGALSGFIKCSDDRLYHPVVAEKAVESWNKKVEWNARALQARIAKAEKKEKESADPSEKKRIQDQIHAMRQALAKAHVTNAVTDAVTVSVTETVTDDVTAPVTGLKGQVRDRKGKGQVRDIYKQQHTVGLTPDGACAGEKTNGTAVHSRAIAILDFLNQKCGKNFQRVKANIDPIEARIREGDKNLGVGVVDDACRQIVVKKQKQWGHDRDRREWLRPKTLFGEKNFWGYHGELTDGGAK